ncbi:MAG: hypothetical protein EB060_12760, partial [Proteobacteria bacterium]|nr:hypothetical protein [Pseudomonadota bacterium]
PDIYYLPVQVNWVSRPLYLVAGPNGRLKAVPTDAVKPYLRPERPFAVTYKDYALKNITSMAQGGRRYRVRQGGST